MRWLRVATLTIALAAALVFAVNPSRLWLGRFDFRAFYCASRILSTGADPYRFEPLHSCELRISSLPPNGVVPAPLPPYAIALVVPLSRLPFEWANAVWELLIVAAAITFAIASARLSRLPLWLTGVCAVSVLLIEPILNGALPPIPLALLTASAVAIARARWTLASVLLGFAAVQPHLALPAVLAAFVLIPQIRWRLALAVALLAILSVAIGGVVLNTEYVFAVLPAHAASEIGMYGQYGLSAVLYAIGVPAREALAAGALQYAAFTALGVVLALLLRREIPASAVLAPMACAVTGGTFVHQTEIAAALPLALVLAARYEGALAWAAVMLLAVPWEWITGTGLGIVAGVIIASVLRFRGLGWLPSLLSAATATAALTAYWLYRHPVIAPLAIAPTAPGALAQQPWAAWQSGYPAQPFWIPAHLMTYAGLGCLYAAIWKATVAVRSADSTADSTVEAPRAPSAPT